MDYTAASVCEEQRRLEEEQLLGSGNSNSEPEDPDENELLQMDIDDEDATKLPKPARVGMCNHEDLVTDTGRV